MTTPVSAKNEGSKAAHASHPPAGSQQNGFMHWLDQVSQATDYMWTHPISDLSEGLSLFAGLVTGNGKAAQAAANRLIGWQSQNQTGALKRWTQGQIAALEHQVVEAQAFTIHLVHVAVDALFRQLTGMLEAEADSRIRGDKREHRYTAQQIRALHSAIEHEAASAYRAGFSGRLGVASRLADYLINHNGLVSAITRDLISGILDLASVDDPIARLAVGFLLKHVIQRLGVDKLAGSALSELLAPLLGNPRPRNLPEVIRDVSGRLGALEGQQAQFWAHGGSDVEQAGQQWAAITHPLIDAALLAWLGEAVIDPERWARQLSGAVNGPMNAAATEMHKLIKDA